MAIPLSAKAFKQPLDPSDRVDFYAVISQGAPDADPPTILLLGEAVASYTLAVTPEAAALGVRISTAEGYAPSLAGNVLTLWMELDPVDVPAGSFDNAGVIAAVELTVVTTSTPPRRKQRSMLFRIVNL